MATSQYAFLHASASKNSFYSRYDLRSTYIKLPQQHRVSQKRPTSSNNRNKALNTVFRHLHFAVAVTWVGGFVSPSPASRASSFLQSFLFTSSALNCLYHRIRWLRLTLAYIFFFACSSRSCRSRSFCARTGSRSSSSLAAGK